MALRADWQAQLRQCHAELGFRYVRFHGVLSDDMGTLVCEKDQLLYSFFNADRIIDFLLSIGMKPFVELSFMPLALASGQTTVFRYQANVTPPRDYAQWSTLIRTLVRHCVDRYGVREVGQWFFEVWNEPNLPAFWTGSPQDYFTLYRHTVEAIKRVDGWLRVGGPATAQSAWIPEFLEFCHHADLPVDFISTHYYPTDAFGRIGADTAAQLEHAPRNVMRDRAAEVHRQARGLPVYYTEWNVSSNPRDPLHDQPFAAAYAARILMNVAELVQAYSFWTFSDLFAENYYPSVPFHGGFGLLNLHGIPKPVYRAFELLHRFGTERFDVEGSHATVDARITRRDRSLTVLLTNHAQPKHPIRTEHVVVELTHGPAIIAAAVERIDEAHANPRRLWCEMGQPTYLSTDDVERLIEASKLSSEPLDWTHEAGVTRLEVDLPPHGIAMLTLDCVA